MYSYCYDTASGGIVLNSSPTVFSKEPRPVWAPEMNLLGFHRYWDYDAQCDIPYMWAESNVYWYHGTQIAKTKGGDLFTAPELIPIQNEDGSIPFSKESGFTLLPIDIPAMCQQNEEKFSHVATLQEIAENDYNLNIPRYVDTFEEEELIDIDEVKQNIANIEAELAEVQAQMKKYMEELGL